MNHNVARFTAGHNLLNGGLYIYIKWWSWSPLRRGKEETTTNLCTSHTCANFRKQVNPEAKAWWWWWRRHGSHSTGVNDHFSLFAEIIRDKPMKQKRGLIFRSSSPFWGGISTYFSIPKTRFSQLENKRKNFPVVVFVFLSRTDFLAFVGETAALTLPKTWLIPK